MSAVDVGTKLLNQQIARTVAVTKERDELREALTLITNRFESFGNETDLSRLDRAAIANARVIIANTGKDQT